MMNKEKSIKEYIEDAKKANQEIHELIEKGNLEKVDLEKIVRANPSLELLVEKLKLCSICNNRFSRKCIAWLSSPVFKGCPWFSSNIAFIKLKDIDMNALEEFKKTSSKIEEKEKPEGNEKEDEEIDLEDWFL